MKEGIRAGSIGMVSNSVQTQVYVQTLKYSLKNGDSDLLASIKCVSLGFPFYYFKQCKYMEIDAI